MTIRDDARQEAERVKIGAVCYKGNHLDLDGMVDRGVCGSHEYQSIYLVVETDYPNPRGDAPLTASHVATTIRATVEADEQADRDPSDAEVLDSARAVLSEMQKDLDFDPEYDYWEDAMRYAQAALLAAQEVRNRG